MWGGTCPLDFGLSGDRVASQENLVACSLIFPASSPASPQFTVVASPIGRPRHKAIGASWQHGVFPLPLSCCPEVSGLISTGTSLLSLFSTSNIMASNPRDIGYPFWGGSPQGFGERVFHVMPLLRSTHSCIWQAAFVIRGLELCQFH